MNLEEIKEKIKEGMPENYFSWFKYYIVITVAVSFTAGTIIAVSYLFWQDNKMVWLIFFWGTLFTLEWKIWWHNLKKLDFGIMGWIMGIICGKIFMILTLLWFSTVMMIFKYFHLYKAIQL